MCKIYHNVVKHLFTYILVHRKKLKKNKKLKFNVLVKSLHLFLKKLTESKEREKVKKYSTVSMAIPYACSHEPSKMSINGGLEWGSPFNDELA